MCKFIINFMLNSKTKVMRKIVLALAFVMISGQISIAQGVEPTYEKQDDLVKVTYYYENGQVKEQGYFKGDKVHDQWVAFDKEGNITTIARFDHGKKDGTWFMEVDGKMKELTFEANKLLEVEDMDESALSFNERSVPKS